MVHTNPVAAFACGAANQFGLWTCFLDLAR
jgi:hypothetical protein